MSKFGGEGTGFKSMKDVNWKNDEDVTLTVKGEIEIGWETNFWVGSVGTLVMKVMMAD